MELLSIPRAPTSAEVKRKARPLHTDEVLIDRQSYRDLEIFDADGAPSLYDLLNKTRTNGGSHALEARMHKPWSSVDRIRAVQDSIGFILEHRQAFDSIPGESTVSAIEHYLNCALNVVTTNNRVEFLFEAVGARMGDGRNYWHLSTGVPRLSRLIHALRRLAFHPSVGHAGGDLGRMLEEMRALLDLPVFAGLPAELMAEVPFMRVIRLDRVFRLDYRAEIERMLRLMFEIDALVAMADTMRQCGFIMPAVEEGPLRIVAEGIYHPFVTHAVPNTLKVDQQQRLLFITGPNMAGKTTYLRAAGIATYLAHLGMGVPARSFRFTPCDSLFTAISLVDNVREGVSFFRAEALRVKAIAHAIADGRRVVAMLDEPFMGTNVKDAVDASRAVLLRLAAIDDAVFMVSSHLIELGEVLEATGTVDCCRFDANEESGTLQFDYVLRPGVSSQRLGLRVLQQEGVFDLLQKAAENR